MANITTQNPATGEKLQSYDVMSEAEALERLEASHEAFLEWRKLSHAERAPYLEKIAQKLRDNADELAELMTKETGKLLKDGHTEIEICAGSLNTLRKTDPICSRMSSGPTGTERKGS